MKTLLRITLLSFLLGTTTFAAGQASLRDQAREAAAAGQSDAAIRLYRSALQQDPKDADSLAALSNLLEAGGRWREAVPLLETLVVLQPDNRPVLSQLGRFKSWQGNSQRTQALDLLRRGCEGSNDNPEFCDAYAEVLSWGDNTRPQAIQRLETTLAAHPDSAATRVKLAQILSWRESTRPQAGALLEAGLKTDPGNKDLLLASAAVLSWNTATRAEALVRYNRVLETDPDNAQALVGKARLLAWQDRSDESLELYQRVLAKDPNNVAAMQGRATILNWKGRHKEARVLALRAHAAEPADRQAALELALADIGLNKFSEARDVLSGIDGSPGPDFDAARQEVRRGLGSYIETGYGLRKEQGNLEFNRFDVAISSRLNAANRVTFVYQPTLYNTQGPDFNTNYFGVSLDSEISDRLTTHVRAGAEVFHNTPVGTDGGVDFRFKPIPSTSLRFGFQRQPLQESLLALRGEDFGGQFFGHVYANLPSASVSYENRKHAMDASLTYTDGVYTGENIDSNRRFSLESQVGKSVRSDKPYLRVAYSVNYTSFDHDADTQTGQPITHLTGGYFSPTRFLLNQGVLNISHSFSRNVQWTANGAAGVQNVETSTASFSNTQFASSFDTHLMWRFTPTNELRLTYDYLNVFNAFQRNYFRFSWRHYL